MSAVIHHKTKKILGFNLSLYNDNSLVIDNIKKVNFPKNFVIHSDHGSQYSSKEYLQLIERLNGKVSMSRIGNSLDNREIEYFFSVLKTEMFENFEKSVKKMTLKELERPINESSSATYVLGFFIIAFLHNMWRMPHLPLVWNQGAVKKIRWNICVNPK
nr:hypothetical protein [Mycoplasmopsis bovis]